MSICWPQAIDPDSGGGVGGIVVCASAGVTKNVKHTLGMMRYFILVLIRFLMFERTAMTFPRRGICLDIKTRFRFAAVHSASGVPTFRV
jgi:hypothetical protein